MRVLLGCLGPKMPEIRVNILEYNEGAIKLAWNPMWTNRTKNVDVRHYFLRETMDDGDIGIVHISTLQQVADAFIKDLSLEAHSKHRMRPLNLVEYNCMDSVLQLRGWYGSKFRRSSSGC